METGKIELQPDVAVSTTTAAVVPLLVELISVVKELTEAVLAKKTRQPGRPRAVFAPPTTEEVAAYMGEIGLTKTTPQWFVDYYTAREWRFGNGQRMKDWKATLRMWKKREDGQTQEAAGGSYCAPAK